MQNEAEETDLPIASEVEVVASPSFDDSQVYEECGPSSAEHCVMNRAEVSNTDLLDVNKELLHEADSVMASIRAHLLTLSKIPHADVGEYMSKVIADMKELNEDTVGVIQRHHKHTLDQMARRSDLPATGRLPNHAAIRLKKRSTSKRSGKTGEEPESQLLEQYNVDDLQCCILCYRRIPETDAGREFDEWVKCSACGMWAHEACAGDGTACPYDEGCFQFSQMPN